MRPALLIHSSLYFNLDEDEWVDVLRFSLENDDFSLIDSPPPLANEDRGYDAALMITWLYQCWWEQTAHPAMEEQRQ